MLTLAILCTIGMILLVFLRVYYDKSNNVLLTREEYNYRGSLEDSHYETESGSLQDLFLEPSDEIFKSYNTHTAIAPSIKLAQLQKPAVNRTRRGCSFNGYILVGRFTEQLESSVYGLYQLSNIASSWDMQIVEPHITGSNFALNPTTSTNSKPVFRFSNIYNLTDTNTLFQTCLNSCLSPLIPFGQFIENLTHTPVIAVVLYLLRYSISHNTCISERYSHAKQLVDIVDRHLTTTLVKGTLKHIKNFDIVCIDISKANDFKQLLQTHPTLKKTQESAINSHSKLLILISKWNGIRNYKDRFFYYDPSWKQNSCPNVHSIKHSHQVVTATDAYFSSLNLKHPLLGVHVRFERVFRLDKSNPRYPYTSECVEKFLAAAKRLMLEHHFNHSTAIAFRDFGPQGSATCYEQCNKAANDLKIDKVLNSLNIRTLEYANQYFKERAFVASVELELLSRVDHLLTLGYGSFQSSIVKRFLNKGNRRRQRLVAICSEK